MNREKVLGNKLFWAGISIIVIILLASVSLTRASYQVIKDYDIILHSPVKVIRYDTTGDNISVTVVRKDTGAVCPGLKVFAMYTEPKCGILDYHFLENESDSNGVAIFPIPGPVGSTFRPMTFFVDGEAGIGTDDCGNIRPPDGVANVTHLLLWYANVDLPASVQLVSPDVRGRMCFCPCGDEVLTYRVTNGWGDPIAGVEVFPVLGSGLITDCPLGRTSDSNGEVFFPITAGCEEMTHTFQVKLGKALGYIQSLPLLVEVGYDCEPVVESGEVATIEASNATSYDGTLPVFDLSIGQSFGAVFIAKDSSGNPVSGVSLTSVYPSYTVTTDGNGQATVTLTGASMAGSDVGKIHVTSDSGKFLDFRIVTGGSTPTPTPTPTGDVASIEAVNPTSVEDGKPIFEVHVGASMNAVFRALDVNGQPVVGVQLSVLFPSMTLTTDSQGQISVPTPVSQYVGWDDSKVWVTSDSNVFLDFEIEYDN